MGKASKWFRGLLGLKKPDSISPSQTAATTPSRSESKPPKRRWSFVKSYREKDRHTLNTDLDDQKGSHKGLPASYADDGGVDPSKHAIVVAAATAAVAEAAVAAAHAAAAVVRLTSSGRSTTSGTGFGIREVLAAVKIQSNFRAYLSRRALRALKALVKLQALVRGHIVRKQTGEILRGMQALLRAQTRARAGRSQISESSHSSTKSSQFHHPGPATPEKFEHAIRSRSAKHDQSSSKLKRSGSISNGRVNVYQEKELLDFRMEEGSWERRGCSIRTGPTDDEKSDKILEVDTGKPHLTPQRKHLFQSSHRASASDQISHSFTISKDSRIHQRVPSSSSCEVQSLSPLKFTQDVEETSFCTADNSPRFYSASSKGGSSMRGPSTPKSDGSRSCLSGYSDNPSYMAYTESSKAKMRSLSAPRLRPQFEKSSTGKRYSMHANFASKAYPGSGRLDRLGMPVGGDTVGFSGGHWSRY